MMRPRRAYAVAAAVTLAGALAPQFDALGDRSFAAHMAQHLLLLFAVPLFALLADPFGLIVTWMGKGAAARVLRLTAPLRSAPYPAVSLIAFIATLWIAHYSPLYELSLEREWVHGCEHGLFLCAGVLFWLPVVAPPPMVPPPFPLRLLYLMIALPQGALLSLALNSGQAPLYAHYARELGVAQAAADQSNAAAVMWIGGGLIVFAAFLATLGCWAARERRAVLGYND